MNIGDRIKQRRIEMGLDADELASKIGKSRATIYRYENGDIENMPTTVLEPIAKVLHTTPAYLMGWESEKDWTDEMLYSSQQNAIESLRSGFSNREINHFKNYIKLDTSNKDRVENYTKKLLSIQEMDDALELNAAHVRTDISIPEGIDTSEDDIMDDINF